MAGEPAYQRVDAPLNIPGTSAKAKMMLPLRLLVVGLLFTLFYPIFLLLGLLRAIFLRVVKGTPSQILKYGTYGDTHAKGAHYPCQQIYKEPLDEVKFRKALVDLCAEDGIDEKDINLVFHNDEKPNDWPKAGGFAGGFEVDCFIESLKTGPENRNSHHYMFYLMGNGDRKEPDSIIQCHIWNNARGKPTVMYWGGSGMKWDGSANFNFVKELINRYMGMAPNKVFQKPEIKPESAAKFDQGSFLAFLLQMPVNTAINLWNIQWNGFRSAKWAGGNGFGPRISGMNFNEEESGKLYHGAKKVGLTPFGAMAYAVIKACKEVMGDQPRYMTQQSSLQT
eukprot:gnl/TRDRNA2_/TRDRNA2_156117_c1_seq1.p1 gnl/TRDRNA2_/TRDRNA2_156117_c1~~gnl/TRDRNA2_/TRDRNA2_156117_c1_seq1.p1  ORF type:complete len:353 (+),score=43.69 gnl/TRDRNA2_/TRDRNA2_156117_c1_seq1:50-1060(+)